MNRTLNTNITRLKFKNSHIVYENFIKCTIKDYEYNLSYNPTLLSGSQGVLVPYSSSINGNIFYINSGSNYGILKDFVTGSISGSDFSPYVGGIGLYNDAGDLLALGKMAAPMPLSSNTDVSFLIKLDTQWVNKPYFTPTPSVTKTPAPTPSVTPTSTITPTPTPSTVDCTVGTASALYVASSPSLTPTPSPSRKTARVLTLSSNYSDACNGTGTTIPGVTYDGATFCTSTIFTSNTFAGYNATPVFLSDGSGNYISAAKTSTTTYQALTSCISCPTSTTTTTLTFTYNNGYFQFTLSNPIPDPIAINQAQVKTYTSADCLLGERLETTAGATVIFAGDTTNQILTPSNYVSNVGNVQTYTSVNSIIVNGTTLSNGSQIQVGSSLITISILSSCNTARLSNPINVRTYGAMGNGVNNDTTAIQNAINDGFTQNREIYIPAGNYLIDTIYLKPNTFMYGDGIDISVLTTFGDKSSGVEYTKSLIVAYPQNGEANIPNITLKDFTVDGKVQNYPTFCEQCHNIDLTGVDNILIKNIKSVGFRGDGILFTGIVRPDPGPPSRIVRNNSNIYIKSCIIDGINTFNRNAISLVDGHNVTIDGCTIKNCASDDPSHLMPGAIDIEPDIFEEYIQNVTIKNCTFEGVKGIDGVIGIALHKDKYNPLTKNFTIINNTFVNNTNGNAIFQISYNLDGATTPISSTEANLNVLFKNNTITNSSKPFNLINANNVTFEGNTYTDCAGIGFISYPNNAYVLCRNIFFNSNTFNHCGYGVGAEKAITIWNVNGLTFNGNNFINCGRVEVYPSYSYTIQFGSSAYSIVSSNVSFLGNTFSSPNNTTAYAIKKETGHTFTPSTNQYYNNRFNGLTSEFQSSNSGGNI